MNSALFAILTVLFIVISVAMVLIILVQRPQGGGLAGAFGGAGGGGSDTVFGGRVGDALTTATVVVFVLFMGAAIGLNLIDHTPAPSPPAATAGSGAGPRTPVIPDLPPFGDDNGGGDETP